MTETTPELQTKLQNLSLAEGENWKDVKDFIPEKYITNAERVLGWESGPTRIQVEVLKKLSSNEEAKSEKHIVAQAEMGSGKTGMFCFAILRKLDLNRGLQALVFCDTMELTIQTAKEMSKLAGNDVRVWTAFRGEIKKINNEVEEGDPHIIVGTVGTLFNMVKKRNFKGKDIDLIVVDEADKLVRLPSNPDQSILRGFKMILDPDYVPKPKPKPKPKPTPKPKPKSDPKPGPGYDIVRLTTTKDLAGNHIKKFKIKCSDFKNKMQFLVDLYGFQSDTPDMGQCIVFCNSHASLGLLDQFVKKHEDMKDTKVLVLHGGLGTSARKKVVQEFSEGCHKIVMCTFGVLSRGFNLPDVSVVINFEAALTQVNHLHRMGRCGRIDQDRIPQKGVCITLLGDGYSPAQPNRAPDPNRDVNWFKNIEKGLKEEVKSVEVNRRNIKAVAEVFKHAQRAGTSRE
eukprot:jgi/Bigna1/132102/aug1.16_g6810